MKYPTKILKYSGSTKVLTGDTMVYQQDGSVITLREVFAGYATGNNCKKYSDIPRKIEFYTPKEP